MPDEDIRDDERRMDLDPMARAAWLAEKIRRGTTTPRHVSILAFCGDQGAALLHPPKPPGIIPFLAGLADYGPKPIIVGFVAAVGALCAKQGLPMDPTLLAFAAETPDTGPTDRPHEGLGRAIEDIQGRIVPLMAALPLGEFTSAATLEAAKQAVISWALEPGPIQEGIEPPPPPRPVVAPPVMAPPQLFANAAMSQILQFLSEAHGPDATSGTHVAPVAAEFTRRWPMLASMLAQVRNDRVFHALESLATCGRNPAPPATPFGLEMSGILFHGELRGEESRRAIEMAQLLLSDRIWTSALLDEIRRPNGLGDYEELSRQINEGADMDEALPLEEFLCDWGCDQCDAKATSEVGAMPEGWLLRRIDSHPQVFCGISCHMAFVAGLAQDAADALAQRRACGCALPCLCA